MSQHAASAPAGWNSRLAVLRRGDFWRRIDGELRRWGPLLLLVLAVLYYGQYYRSGLNLGGEGGTAAVNAIRLNEGWLPIRDTTLNYNVMWFYPVAWLFQITGPDYIALRVYFFALCATTAVIGFLIVRRVTGLGWFALGVGAVLVLVPGMLFRNYMGLLTVLNAWALLHAFVFEPARGWRKWAWFAAAGLVLGLTWLVRIDVGLFFTALFLGLVAVFPFGVCGEFWRRLRVGAVGGLIGAAAAVAIQAPFFVDANRRGFGAEFAGDYLAKWSYLKYEASKKLPFWRGKPPERVTERPKPAAAVREVGLLPVRFQKTPRNWVELARREQAARLAAAAKGRPRPELRDIFRQKSFYDAAFVLVLYLPIAVSGLLVAGAGGALLWAFFTGDARLREPALVCLVTTGAALTLFPQYFFFRPDTPHLSEFMIPFLVALACAGFYAARVTVCARSRLARAGGAGFVLLLLASEGLYFYHAFPKESAGTIAAARRRSVEFFADNGVRVWVKSREQPWLQALQDTIVRHSAPGEWVVTFPYSPTINFMTNRPSYLKDLYIDNATAGRNFRQEKIEEIEAYRPAVIVIDQRDINDTEASRFRNWAAPTYDYIRSHYVLAGTFGLNEVYVRPDKIPPES